MPVVIPPGHRFREEPSSPTALQGLGELGETLNKSKNSVEQRLLLRDICARCVICGYNSALP